MKLKQRILLHFSTTIILLTGISLILIYWLFSEYREESFQRLQKDKAEYTVKLLSEFKEKSEDLALLMDELTIHDFYDEKMLIFDQDRKSVFSSIDDLEIETAGEILQNLSPARPWIETKEGKYDLIGVYIQRKNTGYFVLSKALDESGYSKLRFLGLVLIGIFIFMSLIVFLISRLLAEKTSRPLTSLAQRLTEYNLDDEHSPHLKSKSSIQEIQHLTDKFNELLKRTREAFTFQKHSIQHISHELKTPIAILVTELERVRTETIDSKTASDLEFQTAQARELGNIIHVLLEIAKIETGGTVAKEAVRVDEMIFDLIDSVYTLRPDFRFSINYWPSDINPIKMTLPANPTLIRQVFLNLLTNSTEYSTESYADILIDSRRKESITIRISNPGTPLGDEEERFLFNIFFRGKNSSGKHGYGLGLALSRRIIESHGGTISYTYRDGKNVFEVRLPYYASVLQED